MTLQAHHAISSFAVLLVAVLSGCVEQGPSSAPPTEGASQSVAPPGQFDETTGAVSGVVTDPELGALVDAQVALQGTAFTGTTAQDGGFSFSLVPPGEYDLLAGKLGYTSGAIRIKVDAGAETSGVKVILDRLPVIEPRVVVYSFKGFITCSVGYAVVLSEECGQGLQSDAGNVGADPNNRIDWKFNLTDFENLETVYMELNWQPASAAAQQFAFNVAHGFKCTPSCEATTTYCGGAFENYGRPIVDCELAFDDLKIKDSEMDKPFDITARAWAAPSPETDAPNLVVQQSFDMYRTEFYGEAMPVGYSAIQDQ